MPVQMLRNPLEPTEQPQQPILSSLRSLRHKIARIRSL